MQFGTGRPHCHATLHTSQGTGPRSTRNPNLLTTGGASAGRYPPCWVDPTGAIQRSGAARQRAVAAAHVTTHTVTPWTVGRLRSVPRSLLPILPTRRMRIRPNVARGALAEGTNLLGARAAEQHDWRHGARTAAAALLPLCPLPMCAGRSVPCAPASRPRHPRTRCRSPSSATRNRAPARPLSRRSSRK